MTYRSCPTAVLRDLLLGLIAISLLVGLVITSHPQVSLMTWSGGILSAALGTYWLRLTLRVHSSSLEIDDSSIALIAGGRVRRILWDEVTNATIRERNNAITRTKRLLIVQSWQHKIDFVTSVLRESDERQVLEVVRRHSR